MSIRVLIGIFCSEVRVSCALKVLLACERDGEEDIPRERRGKGQSYSACIRTTVPYYDGVFLRSLRAACHRSSSIVVWPGFDNGPCTPSSVVQLFRARRGAVR